MALSMHPEEGLSRIYPEHNPLTAGKRTAEKKRSATFWLHSADGERQTGLDPATCGLGSRRSTN